MASSSSYSKLSLFLVALAAVSSPLMAGQKAEAQLLGGLGSLLGLQSLLLIDGNLFCSVTGSSISPTTPFFANATVQLQCGGTVISTSVTNASGGFSILLDPLQFIQNDLLLSNCKLMVKTPLSTCNASLPSVGNLVSSLRLLRNFISGILNIIQVLPTGFKLLGVSS